MQTHTPNRLECAQTLNDIGTGLLDNNNIADHNDQQQNHNRND